MSHSLIQISDCHIDAVPKTIGVDTQANLKKIIQTALKKPFDKLLITGDLTQNGTQYAYELLQKILSPIPMQKLVLMAGNHDNADNLQKTFENNLKDKFSLGDWEVFTLDSTQDSKTSGYLSQTTLKTLAKNLQKTTAKYNIIALHHPIVSMQSSWDDSLSLENSEQLFKIMDKYPKIKAVLWGHAHQADEFNRNKVRLISCPSSAEQFNGESRIGFNRYKLYENGHFEFKTQWIK